MNTLSFENVIEFIREQKTPYIKIADLAKKRVYEFQDSDDYEVTINALTQKRNILAAYSVLTFTCATETIKKGGWQNPFVWHVKFDNALQVVTTKEDGLLQHKGFVSEREANLSMQLEVLKLQYGFQKQIDELKNGDTSLFSQASKFIPFLPLFVTDPKKLAAITAMAGAMNGNNNQQATGMAGSSSTLHSEMAEDEKEKLVKQIEKNVQALITLIGEEKTLKLTEGILKNTGKVDMLLGLI